MKISARHAGKPYFYRIRYGPGDVGIVQSENVKATRDE
jgi:hypothetical protein